MPDDAAINNQTSENTTQSADAQEDAYESSDSQTLNALDELPENKKRASIILIVIATLFVFSIAIIVIMPPLSWSPQQGVKSDYHPVASLQLIHSGNAAEYDLAYQTIDTEISYSLDISQTTFYPNDASSRFQMMANVMISRPTRRTHDDEIAIKLDDVQVHIFDGQNSEISLAGASDLLEGIYIFSRLEPHQGMYSIVPDANINPQVARMLFTIMDAVRQIWAPVPNQKIGINAQWSIADNNNDNADRNVILKRIADASLKSCDDKGCKISSNIRLEKSQTTENTTQIGNGNSNVLLKDGRIVEADMHFERSQNIMENAANKQETTLKFVLRQ